MGVLTDFCGIYVKACLSHYKDAIKVVLGASGLTYIATKNKWGAVGVGCAGVAYLLLLPHRKPPAILEHVPEDVPSGLEKPAEEKILVVGAGFVGLGLAGGLRKQGIPFEQVEADCEVGGNWFHGVYETVHIISSKDTTQFTDFPMPDHYPDFPSYKQMRAYLNAYADHFKLRPHIQLNKKVVSLVPLKGPTGTGDKWQVELELKDGQKETRIYKGVAICIGHHWDCRMPSYPGMDKFEGEIIHSKQYRSPKQLVGKRVLVVGGGNSACDVVVEASRFGESAHMSVRRGYWFMPRCMFGVPMVELFSTYIPWFVWRWITKGMIYATQGSYTRYGLPTPDHEPFDHHPTINSSLLQTIQLGAITPHGDIECFPGGKTVRFKDGQEIDVDLVVCATGYHMSIPMLGDRVQYVNGVPQLINNLLLPGHRNLYVIIGAQVRYGAGPLVTEGSRTIAQLILEQDRCKHHLADIFVKLGANPKEKAKGTNDILEDPFVAFKGGNISRLLVPRLHVWEQSLMKGMEVP
eukprot:comp15588_c0_seq1/m.12694 comp15588_c0_seq1/g.12694  ORF comp15588_c0_seq1/g.12694 comp15588_c0_seq1/m.12694 type:complete len:521 (-) comp15588_c0_seq1:12-1574(-)